MKRRDHIGQADSAPLPLLKALTLPCTDATSRLLHAGSKAGVDSTGPPAQAAHACATELLPGACLNARTVPCSVAMKAWWQLLSNTTGTDAGSLMSCLQKMSPAVDKPPSDWP